MWSLNRDQQCGENYTNTNTLKTFCSGMKQTDGEFATTLGSGFRGTPGTLVDFDNASWNSSQQAYPTWEPGVLYKQGDKVIWNGNIYESLGNTKTSSRTAPRKARTHRGASSDRCYKRLPQRDATTDTIQGRNTRQSLLFSKSGTQQGNEIRQS